MNPSAPTDEVVPEEEYNLFIAARLKTWSASSCTFASLCTLCPLAIKFGEFLDVARGVYTIACAVSRLRILTGGEWCAVPAVLMCGFDRLVQVRAEARQEDFRRLADCAIKTAEGDMDSAVAASHIACSLLQSAGTDLTGAAAVWCTRIRANTARIAGEVDPRDADRARSAADLAAEIGNLCTNFDHDLVRIRSRAPAWDTEAVALAQRYGHNSTRVQRRLTVLHPTVA